MSRFGDEEREEEAVAEEEVEEAAREAGKIGGSVSYDIDDPAEQPVVESGEGEEEGFELAEHDVQERNEDFTPPDR